MLAVQKMTEWRRPVILSSLGIPAAFDNMCHAEMLQAMRDEGMPRKVALWLVSTLRCLEIEPEMGEMTMEKMP